MPCIIELVIVGKKFISTCVLIWVATEIELFEFTNKNVFKDNRGGEIGYS
jgi:hypothetical protein